MLYPVILAGGSGTRLWPLSTKANPKQINYLFDDKSLLQATYQRLLSGFSPADVFVITTQDLVEAVGQQLTLPAGNLLVEPMGRNTAPAIGLAAVQLLVKDKQAIMVTINSDAYVKEVPEYLAAIKQAGELVKLDPQKFILLGIKPQYPETGYGYIQVGHPINNSGKFSVFAVDNFKEKPDLATATQYCASGDHLWNPAIFVFSAQSLLDWYHEYLPEVWQSLDRIYQALLSGTAGESKVIIEQEYQKIPAISIDYGLLEKLTAMQVIPINITWADIGHWRSLRDIQLLNTQQDNVVKGRQVSIDSQRNLLYAENKLIATVGVEDMILVETDKVIFLCPADRAHEVKELLAKFKEQGLEDYL